MGGSRRGEGRAACWRAQTAGGPACTPSGRWTAQLVSAGRTQSKALSLLPQPSRLVLVSLKGKIGDRLLPASEFELPWQRASEPIPSPPSRGSCSPAVSPTLVTAASAGLCWLAACSTSCAMRATAVSPAAAVVRTSSGVDPTLRVPACTASPGRRGTGADSPADAGRGGPRGRSGSREAGHKAQPASQRAAAAPAAPPEKRDLLMLRAMSLAPAHKPTPGRRRTHL